MLLTEITKTLKLKYHTIRKYLHLEGLRGKQIYKSLLKTLDEQSISYSTVQNWAASFKRGKFFNC